MTINHIQVFWETLFFKIQDVFSSLIALASPDLTGLSLTFSMLIIVNLFRDQIR